MKKNQKIFIAILLVTIFLLLNNIIPHANNKNYYLAYSFLVFSFIGTFFVTEKIKQLPDFTSWLPFVTALGIYNLFMVFMTVRSQKFSFNILLSFELLLFFVLMILFSLNYSQYKNTLLLRKEHGDIDNRFEPKEGSF